MVWLTPIGGLPDIQKVIPVQVSRPRAPLSGPAWTRTTDLYIISVAL